MSRRSTCDVGRRFNVVVVVVVVVVVAGRCAGREADVLASDAVRRTQSKALDRYRPAASPTALQLLVDGQVVVDAAQ